ncbi:MAG TPA: hypothetical protein VMW16_06230 [Sedimentisphaerales bacterium]|nr:hypothetical protein [Sedimentisphaerales bacterium]
MKPADNINRLIKESGVSISSEADKRILNDALEHLERVRQTKPAETGLDIWRIVMKSKMVRFAAAAAVILGVILSLRVFDSAVAPAYGISDLPELLCDARTLHIKSTIWNYAPDPNQPELMTATILPEERWIDLENGRFRRISHEPDPYTRGVRRYFRSEAFRDGEYAMDIEHGRRLVWFNRLSKVKRQLDMKHDVDTFLRMIEPEQLVEFSNVGQEKIDGTLFDIWQREFTFDSIAGAVPKKVRCWLSPSSGELGRVNAWFKTSGDDTTWRPMYFMEVERDVPLSASIFAFPDCVAYKHQNTLESATVGEGLGAGWFFMGNAKVSLAVAFILDDGSIILGWGCKSDQQPQENAFAGLQAGGELPTIPVVIYGLKPGPTELGDRPPEISYVGRHLAYTKKTYTWKNGKKTAWFYEWAIYVATQQVSASPTGRCFNILCEFEDAGERKTEVGNPIYAYRIFEHEFNRFVLGAMSELSDNSQPPTHVTYDSVMKLSEQIRASLKK